MVALADMPGDEFGFLQPLAEIRQHKNAHDLSLRIFYHRGPEITIFQMPSLSPLWLRGELLVRQYPSDGGEDAGFAGDVLLLEPVERHDRVPAGDALD